jgi:hypothetical protein
MINFTRAFDSAWERMMVILFRPFDLGKWFAIGLSAFLAGLLSGGNGYNGSYGTGSGNNNLSGNFSGNFSGNSFGNINNSVNQMNAAVANAVSALQIGMKMFLFALLIGFCLLLLWLSARGQFMFLDNVARNRGAIAWPWRAYARQGNSLFLFILLLTLIMFVIFVPVTVVGLMSFMPIVRAHRWPEGGEVLPVILYGLVFLALAVLIQAVFFLFVELGIPLMFRNGLAARAAFAETWRLMVRHPGAILLFVLLRIALFLGLLVVSVIACCVTCCIGLVPYLGTVVLLPALVYIKCFTLDFLAQMGPSYDVWTVDVPPAAVTAPIPPPPPG